MTRTTVDRSPAEKRQDAMDIKAQALAMGAQGDAVCRADDGRTLFAPFVLPGETVRLRPEGPRGELVEILTGSPARIEPICPYFGTCGGCAVQHWAHEPYLAWKEDLIRTVLTREGLETEFDAPFAAPAGTRRRVSLHARRGERGQPIRLGYKARKSWSLVDIEVCPIAEPRLQAAFPALRRLAAPFLEHAKSAPTLHVTLTQTGIDVEVTGIERRSGGGLSADARMRAAEIAAETDMARVTLAGEIVYQSRLPMVRLGPVMAALPPGGFLQAVAAAEDAISETALQAMEGAGRVADLFCGLGTFTFRLASLAPVLAVDSDGRAIAALKSAAGAAPGIKSITAETRDLFRRPVLADELKKIDAVLFDPPRAGALEQVQQIAKSRVGVVVGVSCDAASFARDARMLVDGGFRLERVRLIDQFLWSPQVELTAVFRR